MIKIVSVRSDGSVADDPVQIPIKDPQTGEVLPGVVVTGLPISYDQWVKRLERKYTKLVPGKNGAATREKVDWKQAMVDVVAERVSEWTGIVGADDKPLPVTAGVLQHFDAGLLAQIVSGLTGSEVKADPADDEEFRAG